MRLSLNALPKDDDRRTRRVFLLWPRVQKRGGKRDVRWLEWAVIEEEYDEGGDEFDAGWHFVRFIDPS